MLLSSTRITWMVAEMPCCPAAGLAPPGPAWLVWAGSCPVSPRWRSTWAPARPASLTTAAPPRSYASPPSRVAALSAGAAAPSVAVISRRMQHCLLPVCYCAPGNNYIYTLEKKKKIEWI